MTAEEDFQGAVTRASDDYNFKLVFADWLQDRDDPRADRGLPSDWFDEVRCNKHIRLGGSHRDVKHAPTPPDFPTRGRAAHPNPKGD